MKPKVKRAKSSYSPTVLAHQSQNHKENPKNKLKPSCHLLFKKNFRLAELSLIQLNFISQQASFSTYKHHNTLKSLIGIAPNGALSFISDLWMGSIFDKEITLRSGILDMLEEEDTVLADRGFTVLEPEFHKRKLSLFTPFFLKDKIQFPIDERSENKKVSSHCCHVERAIGRKTKI
ncbi:THAP domain-containing protein 1 [Biomphalaria glabrata]|nr:THAP domain-containing protein 1 [Biomphalaria glabrata]